MDIDEFFGLYNSNQAARHALSQADIVIFLRLTEQQIIALKNGLSEDRPSSGRKCDQPNGSSLTWISAQCVRFFNQILKGCDIII